MGTKQAVMVQQIQKRRAHEHRISFYAGFVVGGIAMLVATGAWAKDNDASATMNIGSRICADYGYYSKRCEAGNRADCAYLEDAISKDAVCAGSMNAIEPDAGEGFPDGTVAVSDDEMTLVE